MKLRRNAAGGLVVGRVGGYGTEGTLEHWLAAVYATLENRWSSESGIDLGRVFRCARQEPRWVRDQRACLQRWREEVVPIARVADGLASYEVAAILRRSVWTARRFLRRIYAEQQRVGPCRRRRWTGRYIFERAWR